MSVSMRDEDEISGVGEGKGLTRGREGRREVDKVPKANEGSRMGAREKGWWEQRTRQTRPGPRAGEGPQGASPRLPNRGGDGVPHCSPRLVVKGLAGRRLSPRERGATGGSGKLGEGEGGGR